MTKSKIIFSFFIGILLFFTACDPIENSYIYDSYQVNVFTVTGSKKLKPDFLDTLLSVNNFDKYDLKTGERACLYLHDHLDIYSPKNSYLEIVNLVEKIPTLDMPQRESIDDSSYNLPLNVNMYYYNPSIWVWNNILNINVVFAAKPEATEFVMVLHGIKDDFVDFNLLAKTTEPSDKYSSKLLSYNIKDITTLFTDEEKEALKGYEKLKFRINLKNKGEDDKLLDKPYFVEKGDFANPLFKQQ